MAQNAITRTRNWAFVMYPDSAPENWRDVLGEHCVSLFVSPLHCSDLNSDGTEKKHHWHVLIVFDGVKTSKQAQAIADSVAGTVVQAVNSLRSYARYLCHLDNPEKAQYDPQSVITIGSVDYMEVISSAADTDRAISDIEAFCDEYNIFSYAGLCRYARDNRPEWTRIIRSHTFHLSAYLRSLEWESANRAQPSCAPSDPSEVGPFI